ncbi:MAG: (Fe-S)-binding protein [Anaerolineales bacterium]|jgi:L-lactate dehydrogenase complex protein LldE
MNNSRPQNAQLFVTCLVDSLQPHIGEAVLKVLANVGSQTTFPRQQTCCGQPAFNAGLHSQARKMAQHTIRVFENSQDPVVIPSGSCTAMIRHGYMEIFSHEESWLARAQAVARRTYELSEFLVDVLGIYDLGAQFASTITYHPSCHLLRGLGVDRQPKTLLTNIQGVKLIKLPYAEECCGFGGVFSVEHPEISAAMLERKILNLNSANASTVITCDTGCLMHIAGGLQRRKTDLRVMHIAEILAKTPKVGEIRQV